MTINIRRWCNYISALGTPYNHQIITIASQGPDLSTKYWGACLSADAVICFNERLKLPETPYPALDEAQLVLTSDQSWLC